MQILNRFFSKKSEKNTLRRPFEDYATDHRTGVSEMERKSKQQFYTPETEEQIRQNDQKKKTNPNAFLPGRFSPSKLDGVLARQIKFPW